MYTGNAQYHTTPKQRAIVIHPDRIDDARLLTLRTALILQIRGMRRRGEQVSTIIRREFKLKERGLVPLLRAFEAILDDRLIKYTPTQF